MRQSRRSGQRRQRPTLALPRVSLGLVVVALLALMLAALAFSLSAARAGIALAPFKGAGPLLYPHLQAVDARDARSLARPTTPAQAKRNLAESQSLLSAAPLSSDLIRSIVLGYEQSGQKAAAEQMTLLAEKMSRRDGLVQLRLAQMKLMANDAAGGVRHFDNYLRTYPVRETDMAITRLVAILPFAEGRKELAPYMRGNNPWVERFLGAAVAGAPQASDVADLLFLVHKLPDGPLLRPHYATLLGRLVQQNNLVQAVKLYPRLPGATPQLLADAAVTSASVSGVYEPAAWRLSDSRNFGGSPVLARSGNAIEFYAEPDTIGIAGAKLVNLAGKTAPQFLYWSVAERQGNPGARARFKLRCQSGTVVTETSSVDLLDNAPAGLRRMAIPSNCQALLVQMEIAGGVGRDAARIVVDRLSIRTAASDKAASDTSS